MLWWYGRLFDSNIVSKKAELNNINISNCISNGPIIKMLGNSNEIFINNLNAFDPLIDNLSDNVINYSMIFIIIIIIIIKFEINKIFYFWNGY